MFLQAFNNLLLDHLRDAMGDPASLRRALVTHPQLRTDLDNPPDSVSVESVPFWGRLGSINRPTSLSQPKGELQGWRWTEGHWLGFQVVRPEYTQIARCEQTSVMVELQDVHGFSDSKSDLASFKTTTDFIEARWPELVQDTSLEQLAYLLSHKQIRIIHSPGADCFARFHWDARRPRVWLLNHGGSHHLAAAKIVAARLGERVFLSGILHTHSINASAVASLRADFEIFAVARDDAGKSAFEGAMENVRATWLWQPLPPPYAHCIAVHLPRCEQRSMRAAAELRSVGFLDLGEYLALLAQPQEKEEAPDRG